MNMRTILSVVAIGAGALAIGACGDDDDSSTSTSGGGATQAATQEGGGSASGKIALLLPESKTARYESQDRPGFENKMKELCPDCEIIYSNADQDASKQQNQAEAALTEGVDVMVLDPVDSASAAAIVNRAKQSDVPVISYDRLILDAPVDYYISFDNTKVGELQATSLSDKLEEDGNPTGPIVKINGAPTDNNAKLFKEGSNSVFEERGVEIAKQYDTPDWSPDKAQQEMEQAITALGKDGFDAVYSANDGMAGGAIAALKGASIDPESRYVTGQDAELAAIQRILVGEQLMTVYQPLIEIAGTAAELAVPLARGQEPEGIATDTVDNGAKEVPSKLLETIAITRDNIADTVVADGFLKAEDICTGPYAEACAEAGIQ